MGFVITVAERTVDWDDLHGVVSAGFLSSQVDKINTRKTSKRPVDPCGGLEREKKGSKKARVERDNL